MIAILIARPSCGMELIIMKHTEWGVPNKTITLYPDGLDRASSDFPHAGVSLHCHHTKHFILASEHKERWVFSDMALARVDLEDFGPEWRDCKATVCRGNFSGVFAGLVVA